MTRPDPAWPGRERRVGVALCALSGIAWALAAYLAWAS
jgi:hypothetical protein